MFVGPKAVNAPLFSTWSQIVKVTEQLKLLAQELSSTENWKQVFTYAGEAIIRWLIVIGTRIMGLFSFTMLVIHQYTEKAERLTI